LVVPPPPPLSPFNAPRGKTKVYEKSTRWASTVGPLSDGNESAEYVPCHSHRQVARGTMDLATLEESLVALSPCASAAVSHRIVGPRPLIPLSLGSPGFPTEPVEALLSSDLVTAIRIIFSQDLFSFFFLVFSPSHRSRAMHAIYN
jgi:hypothetical protein